MRKYLFPLILAVLAAVSCHEPSSRESFVRGKGPYVFGVDLSDTMSVYDFSFYTRTDPPFPHIYRLTFSGSAPPIRYMAKRYSFPLATACRGVNHTP